MGFLDRLRRPARSGDDKLVILGKPADSRAGDLLILEQLRGLGADLSQPRHVLHYVYVPDQARGTAAATEIAAAGYQCRVGEPLPGYAEWSVIAETTAVVDESTIEPTRAFFEGIASSHDGAYDGWEAAGEP